MKRTAIFTLLLLVVFWLHSKEILFVYDGKKSVSEGFLTSTYVKNFLGHFAPHDITHLHINRYPAGLARRMNLVFVVLEEDDTIVPVPLLRDLSQTDAQIVWIHYGIDQFLDSRPGQYGFRFREVQSRDDWRIHYQGEDLPKEDPELIQVEVTRPADVQVFAWADAPGIGSAPYVIRSRNLWYVADSPFSYAVEGGRFLVVADLLHDILGEPHAPAKRALVRIEDVGAWDDPEGIRSMADYLAGRGIPFQVSLIPIFRDPVAQQEIYLHEKPELVAALRYAVSRGATVVMHGTTHQYRGQSADDYEFWDDFAGRPISYTSPEWVERRVKAGIDELLSCGLYPLAWETPHYAAANSVYRSIAGYFDTFNDRIMVADVEGTQQIFPYPVRLPGLGIQVIPENLGFVSITHPDPEKLLANVRRMGVVRDGVASFFFHAFMPLRYLKSVVSGMQDMGWTFASIRDYPANLHTDYAWVTSAGGSGRIALANQYLHELTLSRSGRVVDESYSSGRMTRVLTRKQSVLPGGLYVAEGADLLPEKTRTGFWPRLGEKIARLLHKSKAPAPLRLCRALVLAVKAESPAEENDQRSFESVLRLFGIQSQKWELAPGQALPLRDHDLVVVPRGTALRLSLLEVNTLIDFVEKGGMLVTDGQSLLAEKLGIRFENRSVPVSGVSELSLPLPNVRWAAPDSMAPFTARRALEVAKALGEDQPLVVTRKLGQGKVMFLGALFDPHTPHGISRFPHFPYYLKNSLEIPLTSRRLNLEFYFDPGLRQNVSWEKLVKRWKRSGVRIVYLAAWHYWRDYRFDYKYFIQLCHTQGIAVYAWFEFPFVSPKMWAEHPEWRERSATGSDLPVGWRQMINLYDPEAREAVRQFLWQVLLLYDWDGVNLAELSYDSRQGMAKPAGFQPFNSRMREEFRKREKFDPRKLFDPTSPLYWKRNPRAKERFLAFRADGVTGLHEFFLEELEKIRRQKKEMEVVVTMLDSLVHPEVYEESGVRAQDIIGLMKRFDFTLQVEDPSSEWSGSPDRYLRYLEVYRRHVRNLDRLMFDINVIDRGDVRDKHLPQTTLPGGRWASSAAGTELAATLYYASAPCGRAGIYCEATVRPFDMDILPFVLGADAEIRPVSGGFVIEAKRPLTLSLSDPAYQPVLDGKKWPFFGTRGISIPSGLHRLELEKMKLLDFLELQTQMGIDGDFFDLHSEGSSFLFRYRSPIPVTLNFNRLPERVLVDDHIQKAPPQQNAIVMPRGRHRVEVVVESPSLFAVDLFGYLSANFFFLLGLLSVGTLAAIYVISRVKR